MKNELREIPVIQTETEAATFLKVKPQTLALWRHKSIGPRFIKVGKCVRYRMDDLLTYLDQRTVNI
jgi:hypothetical protein